MSLVKLTDATLQRGQRELWRDLNLEINDGEFIAVLGPNGAGKTTLIKVLLGLLPLTSGTAETSSQIGYIPQQKGFDRLLPVRGRDLVELGINGNKYGFAKGDHKLAVDQVIKDVGAEKYANKPIGELSGGEQQRLRIAQALASQPKLLLCDEPLLSLDVASQAAVIKLIDKYRRHHKAGVLFVTHEINPVLPYVDRILYLANGQWLIDTPDKVLQSETLSKLYGTPIEVLRLKNRVLLVGAEEATGHHHEAES